MEDEQTDKTLYIIIIEASLSEPHPSQVYECSVILLACLNATLIDGYHIFDGILAYSGSPL